MTKAEEEAYLRGEKRAWTLMLRECIRALGSTDPDPVSRWILERQETLLALRELCRFFGDNEWSDDLYLPDVINNHLRPHLEEDQRQTQTDLAAEIFAGLAPDTFDVSASVNPDTHELEVWVGHDLFEGHFKETYPSRPLQAVLEDFLYDFCSQTHYDTNAVGSLREVVTKAIAQATQGLRPGEHVEGQGLVSRRKRKKATA